jgi:integrase/recombinase XerD
MTRHAAETYGLYTDDGSRKYLNDTERERALAAVDQIKPAEALFTLTLAWTGARVSEVLHLSRASFQMERSIVAIRTLKRRRLHIREVPIPPFLMRALDKHFRLSRRRGGRLWTWSRVTAWRIIKRIMGSVGIYGVRASPRGLRHAFGVGTLQAGVPITTLQKWLGHARLSSTAVYTAASGPEDIALAARYWRFGHAGAAHGSVA